jgi:hypothetical protein
MVGTPGVGPADRETVEHALRAQARKHLHRMWVSETDFHVGFGA